MLLACFFSFVVGASLMLGAVILFGAYISAKEKLEAAEKAKKAYEEEMLKQQLEREKALQMITEIIKRRQQAQAIPPAPVSSDPNVAASVKDRLRKAVEITTKQAKIDIKKGPVEQLEYNELELEKFNVLKTIIADGFDPLITIRYNTGDQEMLLSAYIQSIQKGLA